MCINAYVCKILGLTCIFRLVIHAWWTNNLVTCLFVYLFKFCQLYCFCQYICIYLPVYIAVKYFCFYFKSRNTYYWRTGTWFASGNPWVYRWRTKPLFASGKWTLAGEPGSCSPVVTNLPLANMMFASGKLLPLAIWALANRMFASGSQNRFASDRLFPTSGVHRKPIWYEVPEPHWSFLLFFSFSIEVNNLPSEWRNILVS